MMTTNMMRMMSILTSASLSLLPAAFYSYTLHLPSPTPCLAFLISLYPYWNHHLGYTLETAPRAWPDHIGYTKSPSRPHKEPDPRLVRGIVEKACSKSAYGKSRTATLTSNLKAKSKRGSSSIGTCYVTTSFPRHSHLYG